MLFLFQIKRMLWKVKIENLDFFNNYFEKQSTFP